MNEKKLRRVCRYAGDVDGGVPELGSGPGRLLLLDVELALPVFVPTALSLFMVQIL